MKYLVILAICLSSCVNSIDSSKYTLEVSHRLWDGKIGEVWGYAGIPDDQLPNLEFTINGKVAIIDSTWNRILNDKLYFYRMYHPACGEKSELLVYAFWRNFYTTRKIVDW